MTKNTLKIKITKDAKYATGKRKTSIAKIWLFEGSGNVSVNNSEIKSYLKRDCLVYAALHPIKNVGVDKKYDVVIKAQGGGYTGQAYAIQIGLAKALVQLNETFKKELKIDGFLTRDNRIKERKKYGLRGARKRPQYRKR